jgi:hypothetical protein
MNPENALILAGQHHHDMRRQAAESRRGPFRFPRWNLTWSRTSLSSTGRSGSALVIIISAHRPA